MIQKHFTYMKKRYFFAAAGLMMLAACTNNDEPQVEQYGTISLGMSSDISVSTRATTLDAAQLANYQIAINQSGTADAIKEGTYASLFNTGNTMTLKTGTGYTLTAASCTDAEAESANENKGQMQLKGTSSSFAVNANQTTNVTVACTVANATLSVMWDSSITSQASVFSDLKAEIYENSNASRKFTFTNNTSTDPKPWFNIDRDPELQGTISYKFNGTAKSYTFSGIALAAAKHVKLTISASANNGQISVSITVDDTVTDDDQSITTNPYEQTE